MREEPITVLVVDDDPLQREVVFQKLKTHGYKVDTAENGKQGFEKLLGCKYSLVISDLDMPVMDGFGLIEAIREHPDLMEIPVIVMTGSDDVASCDRAFNVGATNFLPKPINWSLFTHSILYVLRGAEKEQELRVAKELSQSANRQKDTILSIISHELRTPLHAISGFSKLLTEEHDGPIGHPSYLEYAQNVYSAGERMTVMVNELLTLSKLLAADFAVVFDEYTIGSLFADILGELNKLAGEKKLRVSVHNNISAEAEISCDRSLLKRAFSNLMNNAVTASPEGATLIVRFEVGESGLVFSIEDQGQGINPEELENMFEAFVQGDNVYSRNTEGLGVGLTIARSIAQAHGGDVQLISKAGQGTLAKVVLPARLYSQNNGKVNQVA